MRKIGGLKKLIFFSAESLITLITITQERGEGGFGHGDAGHPGSNKTKRSILLCSNVTTHDKKNNKIAAEITATSACSIAYVMVLLCSTDHIMSLCTMHNIRNAMSVSIAKEWRAQEVAKQLSKLWRSTRAKIGHEVIYIYILSI